MKETKYIVRDSEYCSGAPRVKGTRLTVCNVILGLINYDSIEAYANTYNINNDAVIEAINYCKDLGCLIDADKNRECNFCCNCSLRQFTDPDDSEIFEFYEMLKKANKDIVLEDYIGYRGWKISQKLYEHIILNKNKNTLLNINYLD
ncbi:MAG: DUF433 domain-containing protein [Chitinophagales bacterium]|nr:DUF433 domain-containing protein [Chitinophagales bacterium]